MQSTIDGPVDQFSNIMTVGWLQSTARSTVLNREFGFVSRLTARSTGERAHMQTPLVRTTIDRTVDRSDLSQSRSTARSTAIGHKLKHQLEIWFEDMLFLKEFL